MHNGNGAIFVSAVGAGAWGVAEARCVEMGFTWTFPRNQDATVKLESELISIKF